MADKLTEGEVRHVAKLARLKLDDAQVHLYAQQLSDILAYVEKLKELNVEGVEPMAHAIDLTNRFRDDVPGKTLSTEEALMNAPAKDEPFFKVPKVIGEGSA